MVGEQQQRLAQAGVWEGGVSCAAADANQVFTPKRQLQSQELFWPASSLSASQLTDYLDSVQVHQVLYFSEDLPHGSS